MYNLLIVDDELTIRNGLKSIMDWHSLGIEVVGDVRHGKEALSFMEENTVHLVITDLKMPVMDGMELTAEINSLYPDVKMVILSGYDDFEFARKAIQNNVQDYLLKPVSLQKLSDLMEGLCRDLDEKYAYREKSDLNNRLLNEHQFEIRSSLFNRVSSMEELPAGDIQSLVQLGFPASPASCRIIICSSQDEEENSEELRMIAEVLEESRADRKIMVPFLTPRGSLAILISDEIPIERLQSDFIRISGHTIAIGAGSAGNSWADMGRSFLEAELTFKARPFMDADWILDVKDIPEQYKDSGGVQPDISDETDALNLKLTESLLVPDVWQGLDYLKKISTLLGKSLIDFRIYRQEMVKVVVVTAYNLRRRGVEMEDNSYNFSALLASTAEMKNIKQVERWSQQIVRSLCSLVSDSREIKYKPLVKKAIQYMEPRSTMPLKIEEVAEHLGISANYLSRIFKEETELSFLNWLNRFRIEQSEKMLLDPAKKIYEISEEAGFSDYRYYNKVFRKFKGMTPKEFRKKNL